MTVYEDFLTYTGGIYMLREISPNPVPLPAAAWLLLSGLAGLGLLTRRKAA